MAKNKKQRTASTLTRRHHGSRKNRVILLIGLFLIVTISVVLVIRAFSPADSESSSEGSSSADTIPAPVDPDYESMTDEELEKTVESHTPTKYEGSNPNSFEGLTGAITYSNTTAGKYSVRISIDQALDSSATCTLTISKNGNTVNTYSAPIVNNPASSSCEGFDINLAAGSYTASIDVTSGQKSAHLSEEITIP